MGSELFRNLDFFIYVGRKALKVSEEVYREYYRGESKEKYFMKDLKAERVTIDSQTGDITIIHGREDSYERLMETNKQFAMPGESMEEQAIRSLLLNQALVMPKLYRAFLEQRKINFMLGRRSTEEIDGYSDFIFMAKTGRPLMLSAVNNVIYNVVGKYNKEELIRAQKEHRQIFFRKSRSTTSGIRPAPTWLSMV